MSQGQGKLRASNEARGLSSSTNDVEMMVNHAEKDQPMDVSVTICPSADHVTTSATVITDENNCMDDTSTNDQCKSQMPSQNVPPSPAAVIEEQLNSSPDLAKTLKTVKALKKTFRDTFLKEKEEQNEQSKKTNTLQTDNIVGKEDEKMEEAAAAANTATAKPINIHKRKEKFNFILKGTRVWIRGPNNNKYVRIFRGKCKQT